MEKIKKFNDFVNEEKGNKWIQDTIKNPGSLRKSMKKKKGDKISSTEINSELQVLRGKDKDKSKKGIQGLSKGDLSKYRKLNLAKTLKSFESNDVDNYMFFSNLENICKMVTEISDMDHNKIDEMLTNEHDWAADHISKAKETISHVHNWLKSEE